MGIMQCARGVRLVLSSVCLQTTPPDLNSSWTDANTANTAETKLTPRARLVDGGICKGGLTTSGRQSCVDNNPPALVLQPAPA